MSSSLRRWAFLAASLTCTAPAWADADDPALAEALFRDGRRLMGEKNYAEACPKFEESYKIVPKLGTLLNLATCHDEEGRTGSAWGQYTRAVTEAKEAGEKERVEYARQKLSELEGRLTKLVVEVPTPVPGVEVLIDGRAIGKPAWRTPIPLDPGPHEVAARAPGHATWTEVATLENGPSTATVTVPELKPIGDAFDAENPEPAAAGGASPLIVAGAVVGGLGLVSVGVGSYFGVVTFHKQGDSDAFCDDILCDQAGVDLRNEAQTSATISTVTVAIGLGAVATGVVLLAVGASQGGDASNDSAWTLSPLVGAGSYGLSAGGRF